MATVKFKRSQVYSKPRTAIFKFYKIIFRQEKTYNLLSYAMSF